MHTGGTSERFAYDNDDVPSQSTRVGLVTAYGWNALHRCLSRTRQASGVTISYIYDLTGRLPDPTCSNDVSGNRTGVPSWDERSV